MIESNGNPQTQLDHSSFNGIRLQTPPPLPPLPSWSLPQLSQWEVDWYSLTDVILSVTLNVESICFVRAGLVNIYAGFRARQLAPYYPLPAPNGNVNDVLQIKRSLCKQWPYLVFFTVDCAFCAMSFWADTQVELWYGRLFLGKRITNGLIVKRFISINK